MYLRRLCLAAALTAIGLTGCSPPEENETAAAFPDSNGLTEPGAPPAAVSPQAQQTPVGNGSVEIHTSGAKPAEKGAGTPGG